MKKKANKNDDDDDNDDERSDQIDAYYSWPRKHSMNLKLLVEYSRCTIWPIGTFLPANLCSVVWVCSIDCILEEE